MPKNPVTDPITDQEIAFAHLVLTGTMTDRRAAAAVGLSPDAAAYTKAKPRVRAYMLEHRAAVHERLVQQETDQVRRSNLGREQILARLWEIANLDPEKTRNSASAQIKALSMIIAMEGLIPDRRAVSPEKQSVPPPTVQIYQPAWLREQQAKTAHPHPSPDLAQNEDGPVIPDSPATQPANAPSDLGPAPDLPSGPSEPSFVDTSRPLQATSPHARVPDAAPDNRVPFSIKRNPYGRHPW